MSDEKVLDKYILSEEIIPYSSTPNLIFNSAEDELDGKKYEILTIKYDETNKIIIKRIIDDVRSLIDSKNEGIQKIIKIVEGDESYFIVYESLELQKQDKINWSRNDFIAIIETLNALKVKNREGFIFDRDTIVKTKVDENIKIRFIGLLKLFQELKIIDGSNRLRIKDDIKSLGNFFKDSSEIFDDICRKCINKEYAKYSDLKADLKKLRYIKNSDFDDIKITADETKINMEDLVKELNFGCYWIIGSKKNRRGEITLDWSTKECSGKAFVKDTGCLFIKDVDLSPNNIVLEEGKRARANFENRNYQNESYPIDFFTKRFNNVNQLAELDKTKQETIKEWRTLPEKEKEHIEEQAFKANYTSRKEDKANIIFTLRESQDWEKVKIKKNEQVQLSIENNVIGKILDYKSSKKELTIKDTQMNLSKIPDCGELVEDVRQLTNQYKKQMEACKKFGQRDIANPELLSFLATPEKMHELPSLVINNDKSRALFNSDLDETQKAAVIASLHRKPIYLIQGPPGTGKTTVIVELVQQFTKQEKGSKILVVSQANMAVDNVLKRLPNKEILFMRLVGEHAVDKIDEEVKPHTFDKKLKTWIEDTRKRSERYMKEKYSEGGNLILEELNKEFKRKNITTVKGFQELYRKSIASNYVEKIFEKADSIEQIKLILNEQLGEDPAFNKIHKDWLAFIGNSASTKKNTDISTLKNGSEKINLQNAFVKSMDVLGATCIHIASSKYAKFSMYYDYMIMDEASKATVAEALVPIVMSKNLILIGDHKQLPPIVTREEAVKKKVREELEDDGLDLNKTYGVSLFEKLITSFEVSNQLISYKIMLDRQYRMPRQLGFLISKHIYNGDLKNPDAKILKYDQSKAHKLPLKKPTVLIGRNQEQKEVPNSIIFISTSQEPNPSDNDDKYERKNECNLQVIKKILEKLNERYSNIKEENVPNEIGIIAAYRGQVKLLKNKIIKEHYPHFKSMDINTVDQFQGSEKQIIIYDVVRSSTASSNIGFLNDFRRINVAFSRAKNLLIIVGDSEYLRKRIEPNPQSEIKKEELVIKKIVDDLHDWGCIYHSIDEALIDE